MERLCLITVVIFNIITASHAFLEEDNLVEIVSTLQREVAALKNKSCGCEVKPPVFMTALSADLVHCTKNQHVIFDSVKINQGSGYNHIHGIFTAPMAGIYVFSTTLSVTPGNSYHVAIVKGNATNQIGYLYAGAPSIWIQRSITVFAHMNQNEEVWMVCVDDSYIEADHQNGYGGAQGYHSHFSGFLISLD